MNISKDYDHFKINLRAGIASNKLFEPLTKDLESFTRLAIEKLPSGIGKISNSERLIIMKFLQLNKCDDSLAIDNDFLYELGMQMLFLVESIGIVTICFTDVDGGEGSFWVEGDEEIGFNWCE